MATATDTAAEDTKGQEPVFKITYGSISLSIWERTATSGGRQFLSHDWSLQRFYSDDTKPNGFGYSTNFRTKDKGDLDLANNKAHAWIRTEGKKRQREFAAAHGDKNNSDVPF